MRLIPTVIAALIVSVANHVNATDFDNIGLIRGYEDRFFDTRSSLESIDYDRKTKALSDGGFADKCVKISSDFYAYAGKVSDYTLKTAPSLNKGSSDKQIHSISRYGSSILGLRGALASAMNYMCFANYNNEAERAFIDDKLAIIRLWENISDIYYQQIMIP